MSQRGNWKCWSLAMRPKSIQSYCFYLWWWNRIIIGLWHSLLPCIKKKTGIYCIKSYTLSASGVRKQTNTYTKRMAETDEHIRRAQRVKWDRSHSQSRPTHLWQTTLQRAVKGGDFFLSLSLSLFPSETFSHYRLHSPSSMTSDVHWAWRRKTGEVIHFKRDVKTEENQEKKITLTDQQQSPENTRSSHGPSEKNSA